jgi:DNA polymerase-3 subunit beta
MKFTLNRSSLKEAVAGLGKIVSPKTTLPILAGIRFTAGKDSVLLDGTDLDQHATYHAQPVEQEGAGSFVVPLTVLKDLTKGKDSEHVGFEVEGESVTLLNPVGSNVVRYPVAGLDPSEWPGNIATVDTQPADGFLETYRRLLPFASDDSTRYVLNGVYVDVSGKGNRPVTMVACDGRRLTACNSMVLPIAKGTIVPSRKFLAWSGLEGESAIGVRLFSEVAWFGLQIGPWTYSTRTVDGTFPNWRQVVPHEPGENRVVFTDVDAQAMKKILPGFPGHDGGDGAVGLRGGRNGVLAISGRGSDDKQETVLELTGGSTFQGKDATGVNRAYLLDALNAGFRQFTYADNLCPLKAEDGKGGIHVLMPLRLGNEVPKAPAATEKAPEAPVGQNEQPPPVEPGQKETRMSEKTEPDTTALDKLLAAYEQAKVKLREAQAALVDVAGAIKEAVRENRQLKADVENVRAGLAKLQQIKV